MPRHVDEILKLDAERDHQRIVFLDASYEFPFDTTRALELALFRTYCVPSISGLLARTREFLDRTQKRYDDTDLIVSEIIEHGYDSERGRAAIARMNAIHGRFAIANDDLLYVLSTFIYVPIRWNARFGWRRFEDVERRAWYFFWRAVGERMGIREIPPTPEAFERFHDDFERDRFRLAESNRAIGLATIELFASWAPRPARPLVRAAIHALLDDRLREAFGFAPPSLALRALVNGAMNARAILNRFLPARRTPRMRSSLTRPSHPDGWKIETVGPLEAPPWARSQP